MMKRSFFLSLVVISAAQAGIDDLFITEVVPSTGQVEVTNTGDDVFTTDVEMPFCHRLNYSTSIPAGTEFAPGESRVFSMNFANPDHSDLWLYRARGAFGDASQIVTGLNWGGSAGVGRTGIASGVGLWDGAGSTAVLPPDGMALQLTGTPGTAAGWTVTEPDLGNFPVPVVVEPLEAMIDLSSDPPVIQWSGSVPPFQVETSTNLEDWSPLGAQTEGSELVLPDVDDRQFFRVLGDAAATFRMTFTSTWSREVFSSVPGGDHFSPPAGATHTEPTVLWEPGMMATDGIRQMAETGGTGTLRSEISDAQSSGGADVLVTAGRVNEAEDFTTTTFTANRLHPFFTLVSMIAPSPDWFVGVHGESLLQEDGSWVEDVTFELLAYDAGTDSGSDFTSGNDMTIPRGLITRIAGTTPFAVNDGFTSPQPVATLRIERIAEP